MIARLRGSLIEKHPTHALVDVEGVGYELQIPVSTFERLPEAGGRVVLLTQLVVREDALHLFGFGTEGEREIFRLLLTVSGVGPKIALAVLSGIEGGRFRRAVAAGDVDLLRTIPGIGKKTAERLVVELRDRLPAAGEESPEERAARTLGCPVDVYRDAIAALVSLGYTQTAASAAARMVLADGSGPFELDELVKRALAAAAGGVPA
jgi:Holliday junction DNA helicase RuvA